MKIIPIFLFISFFAVGCDLKQRETKSDISADDSIVSYLHQQTYFDKHILSLSEKKLNEVDLSFLKRFELFYDREIKGGSIFFLTYRGYKNNQGHNLNVFYYPPDSVLIEVYRVFDVDSATYFRRYSYTKH